MYRKSNFVSKSNVAAVRRPYSKLMGEIYMASSINPLLPSVPCVIRLAKIFISISDGIIKKFPLSVATMSR